MQGNKHQTQGHRDPRLSRDSSKVQTTAGKQRLIKAEPWQYEKIIPAYIMGQHVTFFEGIG